jgi:putative pre-16S rRNA nuclease
MARVLGVDLGSRRIGLACSDPTGTIARPLMVLERSGDPAADHAAIVRTARGEEACRIVVGLPLSLSGRDGPAALLVRAEVDDLRVAAGPNLVVDMQDERMTTVTAERDLITAGLRRRRRREIRDSVAAAVMLQSYLDRRRSSSSDPAR